MSEESRGGPGQFAAGSQVGDYRLEQQIGHGGMAVVYRARDLRLDRDVALKILAPNLAYDDDFRKRFIRESRAAAALDNPNIVPVYEAGESDGVLFIAMRFVRGGDVRLLLDREGLLSPTRATGIIAQAASALDSAHASGLVHRDVKPANMLLDAGDRRDHVYLSDFGLSKSSLAGSGLTASGLFLGTLDYTAPEQLLGEKLDGRADQYSLACATFELLTGAPPFRREQHMATMYAQVHEVPPLLSEKRPGLAEAADEVMDRALAKAPEDRYTSCREFASALRSAFGLGAALHRTFGLGAANPGAQYASPPGDAPARSEQAAMSARPEVAVPAPAAPGPALPTAAATEQASPEATASEQAAPGTATPGTATPEPDSPGLAAPEADAPGTATHKPALPGTTASGQASPEDTGAEQATPGTATPEPDSPGLAAPESAVPETATGLDASGPGLPTAAATEQASPEATASEQAASGTAAGLDASGPALPAAAATEQASPEATASEQASSGAAIPGRATAEPAIPWATLTGTAEPTIADPASVDPAATEPGSALAAASAATDPGTLDQADTGLAGRTTLGGPPTEGAGERPAGPRDGAGADGAPEVPAGAGGPVRTRRRWWRSPVLATAASVILVAGGATGYFLAGRKDGSTNGGHHRAHHDSPHHSSVLAVPGCTTKTASDLPAPHTVPSKTTKLSGVPLAMQHSTDGHYTFVTLPNSIEVLRNDGPLSLTRLRTLHVAGAGTGLLLTPDDRYLIAADGSGAVILSVANAESGHGNPILGKITSPHGSGAAISVLSQDSKYLFITLENSNTVAVFNFADEISSGFHSSHFIGYIPVYEQPVGLRLATNPDYLFETSLRRTAGPGPQEGTLSVIDVAEAEKDPAKSLKTTVNAGCSPVRIYAEPGAVWVTARDSNALIAFDPSKLLTDPSHSLLAVVPVGSAPVGITPLTDGRIVVADSNSTGGHGPGNVVIVSSASALAGQPAVLGLIPADGQPFQLTRINSNNTLLVTDQTTDQLLAINVSSMPP